MPAEGKSKTCDSPYPAIEAVIRPYSQYPIPVWSLSALFLASSFVPPRPFFPPIMHRIGFGAIFAGAGYVLSTGDTRNGSGITTAWSLTYLFFNMRKSLTSNRSAVSLALTGATLASTALYGSEYFLLQTDDS
ncbi:Altered inheritance of mitochondria protein 19 homolog [Sparassis crispa]|uniref:Altered inheritance of mitochondria protein 19 homolog n=1 Tax=Sparassis crispa TaxID=139825 RepID=A0A401GDC6_9APHY|nr:Altered inheritance of mitochondria protein 19 homolog [Sparassis crispa]GBE80184.1 Altered inheritance of mitochondria protein 19 homolog [Sparassis crispa]